MQKKSKPESIWIQKARLAAGARPDVNSAAYFSTLAPQTLMAANKVWSLDD